MRSISLILISIILCAGQATYARPTTRPIHNYPFTPVPFTAVHIDGGFWSPRLETNRKVTIPIAYHQSEATGRIYHFWQAAHPSDTIHPKGLRYDDSDVYKIIEGTAYSLQVHKDRQLEHITDSIIDLIAGAQEPDGYIYTFRTMNPKQQTDKSAGPSRWTYVESHGQSHELYNMGHLIEASIAYWHATGKRKLLDVAIKAADCICKAIGPDGLHIVPGHEEIELALCKLYLATGNVKYLNEAQFFIDMRGKTSVRSQYNQSDKPITEQYAAEGHAVRACYLYCGIADVGALTGQQAYINAIDTIWQDIVSHRLYLNGGIGSMRSGEAFGAPYYLPNASAYNETCASIALTFLNQRLFLLHGESKYIDVLERTLYNGLLAGVSLSGDHFFYPNPLAADGTYTRSQWFGTACCPSNICRFIPSLPGYIYAVRGRDVYINLFMDNKADLSVAGRSLSLTQQTRYPWDGDVLLTIGRNRIGTFSLKIRIPGWMQDKPVPSDLYAYADGLHPQYTICVNGKPVLSSLDKGYFAISRKWKSGDQVRIHFDMPVRKVMANTRVAEDAGLAAYERGPIVYCAESVDNVMDFNALLLPRHPLWKIDHLSDKLGGIDQLEADAQLLNYSSEGLVETSAACLTLIPYYAWANRDKSKMAVWLPQSVSRVIPIQE